MWKEALRSRCLLCVLPRDPHPKVERLYETDRDDHALRVQNFSILNRHIRAFYQVGGWLRGGRGRHSRSEWAEVGRARAANQPIWHQVVTGTRSTQYRRAVFVFALPTRLFSTPGADLHLCSWQKQTGFIRVYVTAGDPSLKYGVTCPQRFTLCVCYRTVGMFHQWETGYVSNRDTDGLLFEFCCQYFPQSLAKLKQNLS